MQEEDLGFISEEDLKERKEAKEEAPVEEVVVAPKQWRKISARNVGEFFNEYDRLRAMGYSRTEHFASNFLRGSRVGVWEAEMVLDPQTISLDTLETMSWGAMKALGAELGVESKNRKGMLYAICTKLDINQQVL